MKIAILPLGHRALPTGGGTIFAPGVLATQAAEELAKRGHTVDVWAPKDSKVRANVVSLGLRSMYSEYGHLKKEDPNRYTQILYQYELHVASKLIERSGDYDIIHAHDYRKLLHFSRCSKCPIVYSYHGVPADDAASPIERAILQEHYADGHFIAASRSQVENGKKYFNFIDVVGHGVDLPAIPFSETGPKNPKLLFVGRLMERKRPDLAIRIAGELGVPIDVVGERFPTSADDTYFNQTLAPRLSEDGVKAHGLIGQPEIYHYYKDATALLFPIEQDEAFGMVLIEAMAAGTPVVAFGRSSVADVIEDGVTGYVVKPGDYAGLKKATEKILSLPPDQYAKMRTACRARVENGFTVEKMVDGFERVYAKLANKSDLHKPKSWLNFRWQ